MYSASKLAVAFLCAWAAQPAVAVAQTGSISVQFHNSTGESVRFTLVGSHPRDLILTAGKSGRFVVDVSPGVQAFVAIRQPNGERANFSLGDGGDYVFRRNGGRIENAYREASSTPRSAAPHRGGAMVRIGTCGTIDPAPKAEGGLELVGSDTFWTDLPLEQGRQVLRVRFLNGD